MKKKRVHVITGHFGSGKTEFSVNYVIDLRKEFDKVAILDMDIANPYFRSRERQKLMLEKDISIHFNTYGYDITEDLPAITATVRAPLENKEFETVVDVGGNDSGARVLNQFRKYFVKDDCEIIVVINANRPDTDTLKGCLEQIDSIETEIGIKVDAIINNTHMLTETTADDIMKGFELCRRVSQSKGIPVKYNVCEKKYLEKLMETAKKQGYEPVAIRKAGEDSEGIAAFSGGTDDAGEGKKQEKMYVYPIELQMRPTWLDVII